MKNVFVLMLGLIISSLSFAGEDKDTLDKSPVTAKVSVVEPGKIELAISKIEKVAFIKLKDQNGYLIYDNKIYLKKGIIQSFDVSELSAGKYNLTIDIDNHKINEVIVVETTNAERKIEIL